MNEVSKGRFGLDCSSRRLYHQHRCSFYGSWVSWMTQVHGELSEIFSYVEHRGVCFSLSMVEDTNRMQADGQPSCTLLTYYNDVSFLSTIEA